MLLRLPASRRKRRRFFLASVFVTAVVVGSILFAFFRNTGTALKAPIENKPAEVERTPQTVPASAADQRAAEQTLWVFFRTAVLRRNLAAAWPLATPNMRRYLSRPQWLAGNIPVAPYLPPSEFRTTSFTLTHSYKGVLGYDVLVLPKTTRGRQAVYSCDLHHVGTRWLVDSCLFRTTLG